jgi:biopolymer transport protein ExbD
MARNRKHFSEGDEMTDINISPLIDMVFILLIFFIVTTVFVEEKGMASNTPDPSPQTDPPDEEKERLTLLIKKNGEVFSKIGNTQKNIGVGGVRAVVQQEMQREVYPILVNVEKESLIATYVTVHDTCLLAGAEGITMKVVQGN